LTGGVIVVLQTWAGGFSGKILIEHPVGPGTEIVQFPDTSHPGTTMTEQPSTTDLASTIAKNLRIARSRLGLTQEQIAERSGIATEFYGRLERGKSLPSIPTLLRIAHGMETTPSCLLEGVAIPAKPSTSPV
jgi:DNA-binding XRE family transcriptional regulator